MKIRGVFEAALLKYIQAEVDQLAEGIRGYDSNHYCCPGHDLDDSCCCDTAMSIDVDYFVPREVARFGYKTWNYRGNFFELINMLDRLDMTEVMP